MSIRLEWTGKDGVETAQGFGFEYIANRSGRGSDPWALIRIKGFCFKDYGYSSIKEVKSACQSHHDAICAEIEKVKSNYQNLCEMLMAAIPQDRLKELIQALREVSINAELDSLESKHGN